MFRWVYTDVYRFVCRRPFCLILLGSRAEGLAGFFRLDAVAHKSGAELLLRGELRGLGLRFVHFRGLSGLRLSLNLWL